MDASSRKRKQHESVDDYQVFLSFRGLDTRYDFTDVLYERMTDRAGILVFKDDDEISVGRPIDIILQAIQNSEICVPIFSESFASSAWCLREVERMVELYKKVMPIFYKISPDDVKLRTDLYKKSMEEHEDKYGKDQVEKWESALEKIANIKGMEVSPYTRYTECCQEFIGEVFSKLKPRRRWNSDHLIGMDNQIESVMKMLENESRNVWYIGIHGMGGIGKTTLAKAIFQNLSANFECSCFLEDVRESSLKNNGLQDLRKKLQQSLDLDFMRGCNCFRDIEERFQKKKVLIVLDDVDEPQQVEKLAGQSSWFGSGSRIIVTTRNIRVLEQSEESGQNDVQFFEMGLLNDSQALELFQFHAFRKKRPSAVLEIISREIASTSGGLPLALEVIGSQLYNIRDVSVWRDLLRRLKTTPFGEVMDSLKISYEALADDQKQNFLDIACLPAATMDKDRAIHMWEASKLYPLYNLAVLSSKSLVKLHDNRIWMHDLLTDLGKAIASKDGTRIWKVEQLLEVLHSKEGKEKVEVLYVDNPLEFYVGQGHFTSFPNLRFLHLISSDIEGDFRNLLPNLTWLSSRLCPPILKPTNLYLKNLVVLDLSFSFISESWGGWSLIEIVNHLKVLDLSNCHNLTRTPDFSKNNRLERLDLHHCSELRKIHGSIGNLQKLKYFNLLACSSLEGLPNEIGSLVILEKLYVSKPWGNKMNGDFSLRSSIGDLESLMVLKLEYLEIVDIPYSIGGLANLEVLLPSCIRQLHFLEELNLDMNHHLQELPDLPLSLRILKVSSKSLHKISDLSRLVHLTESSFFDIGDYIFSSQVSTSSKLEGIEKLTKLTVLKLSFANVTALEFDGDSLPLLKEFTIEGSPRLPYASTSSLDNSEANLCLKLPDLSSLKNLSILQFENCYIKCGVGRGLGIWNLGNVKSVKISNCGIEIIEQTCWLKNLRDLSILDCGSLKTLPDLSEMKNLNILGVRRCKELVEIPGPENLQSLTTLTFFECASLEELKNLSKLIRLSHLNLLECPKLRTIEGTEKLSLSSLRIRNCASQAEVQIKRRVGIGNHISERKLLDDLERMGMNDSIVRRALIIMHQRDEVEYKRERRVILRKE